MVRMNEQHYPILSAIGSPADLRQLDEELLPQVADELRRYLIESVATALRQTGVEVALGEFGAQMNVELVNDGPVTIVIESIRGSIV